MSASPAFSWYTAAWLLFSLCIATQARLSGVPGQPAAKGVRNCSRLLVVGADEYAERALHSFLRSMVIPCSVEGFVRLPGQTPCPGCKPLFELEAIETMAVDPRPDDVLIAVPLPRLAEASDHRSPVGAVERPRKSDPGSGAWYLTSQYHLPFRRYHSAGFESHTLRGGHLHNSEARPLISSLRRSLLSLMAPLMLLIAAAIRLTSPGPVFFAQERVGLNGRLFRVYKFRTMSAGNPGESDTRWTTSNDPRRTRLGAFLRATNLDELPQFFNVLKGDMSVVGPRPERPYFVKKFQDDVAQYNTRHYLKVGITGWAQVNGWRGDTSIAKRVEHDLYYLRNWSLWFDMKIIWLTLWRGFFSKNAY